MSVKQVTVSPQAINVQISGLVIQSPSVIAATGEVLSLAQRAGVSAYNYTGDQLTSISYSDFEDVTGHSKTLSYTGDQLTSLSEVFTYSAQTWTYNVTFTYTGEQLTSKAATLNIV